MMKEESFMLCSLANITIQLHMCFCLNIFIFIVKTIKIDYQYPHILQTIRRYFRCR